MNASAVSFSNGVRLCDAKERKMITITRLSPKLAIMTLAQEPVNLMHTKLWEELANTLKSLEADKRLEAVIIESGLKRDVFTAGNDLS